MESRPGQNGLREFKSIKTTMGPKMLMSRRLRGASKALAGHYWVVMLLVSWD